MARKVRTTFFYLPLPILFFFLILYRRYLLPYSISISTLAATSINPDHRHLHQQLLPPTTPGSNSSSLLISNSQNLLSHHDFISTLSVLLPDWEVLVIVSPEITPTSLIGQNVVSVYSCLYPNNDVTPADPAGVLTSPNRAAFKCLLPKRSRRKLPFYQPVLIRNQANQIPPQTISPAPELLRWSHIVYDCSATDTDVVVFAKGLNNRQGINRDPSEFKCVFYREGDDVANGIRTDVMSSMQEVFRCKHPPQLTAAVTSSSSSGGVEKEDRIKVTIETVQNHDVVPTLAYYSPIRKLADENGKSLVCACTMVYNAGKFLKEWVVYHSSIGIQKFILYDNESDDNLQDIVTDLNQQGYDVNTQFWLWPKTQEAGFSHSVLYSKDSCTWMAYIDVDEFIYSPSWFFSPKPFKSMLQYHISKYNSSESESDLLVGQINIGCFEFGPSNQTVHPDLGVTQGYNCRRKLENRHKSLVLMEAIDDSLFNAIHHFSLKPGYMSKKVSIHSMVVNHYKFQAWPEFKAKFRRRVSAYVVDWKNQVNLQSNDRAPGLGYSPVEPQDWPQKFCEVHDNGLRNLTRKWFAVESLPDFKMAWQR